MMSVFSAKGVARRRRLSGGRLPILLLAGLVLCCWAAQARAEPHDPEHRLVFSTFPSGGMRELFNQILTEAYARLGYEIELQGYPAERALLMASEGLADGEAGRVDVVEKAYPNLIRVPTPLYINHIAVLTADPDIDPARGWDQFAHWRTCIRSGYKFLESRVGGENCHRVSSYEKMLDLLKHDRVEVGLAEYCDILPTLDRDGMGEIKVLCTPMASNPMYHYLHKRHADLVPLIDAVLQRMREEGRLKAIEERLLLEHHASLIGPCFQTDR